MSIVIALGVTTPETSYSDMAAGSDPESVEASPAVNEKNYSNHSCGSAQSHGYRGLPYAMQQSSVVCCQDHNYGAPPPPTPPASPLSQTIIPRMELNGVARGGPRYRPGDDDEENSADSDSSSEEDGGVASWCHCSLTQDGFLIKCKSCRGLDRRKGVEGQRRKPENVSVGESSATESGDEEVSPATVSYTATQHTPTSITLTVNRVKRNKSKKRKKSTEKARGTPKGKKVKAFREGSRKSMRMKNSTTDASTVDENTTEGWESKIRQWTDQYEESLANQYSADVQTLLQLHRAATATVAAAVTETTATSPPPPEQVSASVDSMDTINRTELACNNTVLGSQMQLGRVTRVQKHRKILRAAKDLEPDTLIIEYRGKVMLKQQFEVNGHFFKKPYPFVLFYSNFNEVEMCVDARTFGNDARFIRRSCTPNAEVRHVIAEGMIHLCIYAVSQITKDAEVTIGFDYEFNSCNYKVDCACLKGNQNCPVLKHNLSPRETLLCPPAPPAPSSLAGAETRRRKARRREMEGGAAPVGTSDDSNQPPEEPGEARDLQGGSDVEEGLVDGLKLEDGEDGELDENGVLLSSRRTREERKAEAIMQVFENLDKRKRRPGGVGGADEPKQEGLEPEEGGGNPSGGNPAPHSTGVGVSTRRTTYVTEPSSTAELPASASTSSSSSSSGALGLPAPAPAKPPPARSAKPRPKSRISRYRSSSSQRARRQRQALAQQAAAAAEQGAGGVEEGPQGPGAGPEPGLADGGPAAGQLLDGDLGSALNKGNLRYPKTKKYLVTEWLNDKVPDKASQEAPGGVERPLRITTDPTVLATTLNMLPGLSQSPLICTAPKHYVRFGSPFNPERRRPRPLNLDGTYGCYKKRWIQQAQDESCSASLEDGTESTSSHQSNSSSSTPNPLSTELAPPFKKRRAKYASEAAPPPHEHLLRPLSPITPPLPSDPLHPLLSASCAALLLGTHPHHHHHDHDHHGDEEGHRPNGLAYSPLPSLPTSRCNTPLQFENISSPEASPVHRPESVSPEPCLRTDFDVARPQFPDLSLSSSLESPLPVASDDISLSVAAPPQDSQGPASVGGGSLTPVPGTPSDPAPSREQAFRTEFNLIYTCSPLNANLGNPATDRRLSQSEGSFSPAESFYSAVSGQGLLAEAGPGSMSPYGEPHYGGGYPDIGTPPHTSNPPQKKKVSLLEYRKRKQGSSRDAEHCGGGGTLGTPTRPGCLGVARAESPGGLRPHHQHHLHPASSSPHSSFSSPAHPSSSIPQIEEVSPPPEHHHNSAGSSQTSAPPPPQQQQQQGNSHWMVPTTVERLREGQGVLERVLRGSLKMDRMMKRPDGWAGDKDPDADRYEIQMGMASPMKSPHRYSPSVYTHQPSSSEMDGPAFLQQSASSSPYRGSYSPSAPPPSGQGFYPRLSSHPTLSQDPSQQTHNPNQTTSTSSADSVLCGASRPPGGALHQQSSSLGASHAYSGSHLKASLLNSGLSGSPTPGSRAHGHPKTDSGAAAAAGIPASHTSRLSQQQQAAPRTLKPGSPGQAVLQAGSRLLQASGAQHYPQRGAALSQFQHPPIQGSGVRTQSGSF